MNPIEPSTRKFSLNRRAALGLLGSGLGTALLIGCGGGASSTTDESSSGDGTTGSTTGSTTGGTTTGSTTGGTASCSSATPEGEIGPYFTDDSASGFNRSDIRSNIDGTDTQDGIPLTLNFYVYDSEKSCAAVAGSQVDIWHCNSSGIYSNESSESTSGQTWCRGYQVTDSSGLVTFKTIVPGWYQGRTTHIHLRIRSSYSEASSTSNGTNTTQVFFNQSMIDYIDTTISPYNAEGKNSTTNASDRVYTDQTHGEMLLSLSGDYANGYTATFAIYLPITSS